MNHNEPITLHVTQRPGCGTAIFRCNGKVASCTGNEEDGVQRCAAKALAVLAELLQDKSILARKPVIQRISGDGIGHNHWQVTYDALRDRRANDQ